MYQTENSSLEKQPETIEVAKSLRLRINISRGMKGGYSFEATCEGTNYTMEEILSKSDQLVLELEKRYPAEVK